MKVIVKVWRGMVVGIAATDPAEVLVVEQDDGQADEDETLSEQEVIEFVGDSKFESLNWRSGYYDSDQNKTLKDIL